MGNCTTNGNKLSSNPYENRIAVYNYIYDECLKRYDIGTDEGRVGFNNCLKVNMKEVLPGYKVCNECGTLCKF